MIMFLLALAVLGAMLTGQAITLNAPEWWTRAMVAFTLGAAASVGIQWYCEKRKAMVK